MNESAGRCPTPLNRKSDDIGLQRKRFDALVRAHSALVWNTDADGAFVDPQPEWAAYTGQTWEQYKGHGGFEKIHPDDRSKTWTVWAESVRTGKGYEIEMRVWHQESGSWHWCSCRAEPVLDDSGAVLEWIGTMVDVDTRKKADLEVRERERRFSAILERVQAIGLMLDVDGRITFANDFLLWLTGWSREEVLGRDYFELFIQGTSDIAQRFHAAMKNGDIFEHAENEIITRSGARRTIEWDNTVLRGTDGDVIGTASIGRDVTEPRRLLRSVQEKEERLRTLVEAMPQLVWSTRPDGYCDYLSPQWLEYTGQSMGEVEGYGWLIAVHPDDEKRIRKEWQHFVEGEAPYDTEYRLRRSDGNYRWFKARAAAVRGAEGQTLAIYGTSTDIHDQKLAQEAYRRSEEQLRIALNASSTGTFRWDPKSGQFLEFGEKLRELFGFAQKEPVVETQDFLNRVHPEDRPAVVENVARSQQGGDFEMEYRVMLPDSGVRWLYDRGSMIRDDHGEPLYLVGACTDITPRKRAEEALLHSEKLTAAGSLAATLAHEINNPLEALLNLVYIARQPYCTTEQRMEMLKAAEREITRASELAKRSLRFYRGARQGRTESVKKVLESVLYVYEPRLREKNVAVDMRFAADGAVDISESDLRQVFYNLVSNATDAMPGGGTMTVKVSCSDVLSDGPLIRVTLRDTGGGIREVDRGSLFKPFFTTKGEIGTGLGLWVTREIVERHGGSIRFKSSTDEQMHGTVMTVMLPLFQEECANAVA